MKAIIIGGGIGGLTAAIALQRVGLDAFVYERVAEPREVGAGISLWSNAVTALRHLGLGASLQAHTLSEVHGDLRTWRGAVLSATASEELRRDYGVSVAILHRADLLALLLKEIAPSRIFFNRECTGFSQDSSSIEARFANGEEARADVLIGADGINSVVRDRLFHDGPPRYSGYTAWRSIVSFARPRLAASESWGYGRRFGLIPMSNGCVYWYATKNAPPGETDPPDQTKAHLQELFRGWHDPIPSMLEATEESPILRNDIYDRDPLAHWSQERVTLLGDAAHPMTPNLGQGACQAIEDAVVLAACLANSDSDRVRDALRRYEARRIPRTSRIVLISRRIGRISQIENPFLCFSRNIAIRATPKSVSARQISSAAAYDPLTSAERSLFGSR